MSVINILSADVCNRIAAGEVIERPFSVVKELVENAIDAGATEITIETEGGGKRLIRITDNGKGIAKDDLVNAFLPHATSKLSCADDLDCIRTLGFRGEAVASIAAVSRMKILSKTAGAEAYSLECNGGKMGKIMPDAGADGTTVTVGELFFNTPARLKFLKTDASEDGDIANMVVRFILSRPNIAFTYIAGGKVKYRSFGDGLRSALAVVYGAAVLEECYEINADKHGIVLRGFIGNGNFSKPNRSYQSLFVNGRYIVNQTVSAAVTNAYGSYLMKRQYPFYVLFLDVPPEIVDVNVHPNKADVRFADNQIIYGSVYHVVSSVLDGNARAIEYIVPDQKEKNSCEVPTGKPDGGAEGRTADALPERPLAFATSAQGAVPTAFQGAAQRQEVRQGAAVSTENGQTVRTAKPVKTFDLGTVAVPSETMTLDEAKKELELPCRSGGRGRSAGSPVLEAPNLLEVHSPEKEEKAEQGEDFFEENRRFLLEQEKKACGERIDPETLQYKGELFQTYLIYQTGDTAYLIDQHAAHERLIYNRLREKLDNRSVVVQPMLVPYILNVNAQEYPFLCEHLGLICEIGFEIEEFGGTSFKISAVPVDLQGIRLDEFFAEVLASVDSLRQIRLPDLLKDKLAMSACKAAVKGGEFLSLEEVKSLLKWMDGDMSLKCPHGRPVAVKLKKTEIEKMFKRIV